MWFKKLLIYTSVLFSFLAGAEAPSEIAPDWAFAEAKMLKAGLSRDFIADLHKNYDSDRFQSVIELNALLHLRKTDYHSPQISDDAVKDVRGFINNNDVALDAAEKKYGVSRSVIAGLLWMESRYGSNLGTYNVMSVFVGLVQLGRPEVVAHLRRQAAPRFASRVNKKVLQSIAKKVKDKTKWALHELKSLNQMAKRDRDFTMKLRGSFAGAFGLPQFIPSSYVYYARSADSGRPVADLQRTDDAIHSVAFYLKESGWRKKRKASHERALMRYNNSQDYARAILKLASRASFDGSRLPAGKSNN